MEKKAVLIPQSILDSLPSMIRGEVVKLSAENQESFVEEYRRKSKSMGIAYLLWFALGWHYAYLGKWGWQILYWITLAGILIWAIVDAFRIPRMIHDYNKDSGVDVLRNLKAIAGA